jgi:hypothetical protein
VLFGEFIIHAMRPVLIPVIAATAYLFVYSYLAFANMLEWLVMWMFCLSPVVVLWLVYKVLTKGKASSRTFEQYFYEDRDLKPLPGE